jgi:hypothetical protein
LLLQVGDLFELNVKLWCQKVKQMKGHLHQHETIIHDKVCSDLVLMAAPIHNAHTIQGRSPGVQQDDGWVAPYEASYYTIFRTGVKPQATHFNYLLHQTVL